jgi:hypothetical protein
MPDFTLHTFRRLLSTLKEQQYNFQTFKDFLGDPAPRSVVLRHDVDARKMNSILTATMENELGITGTYYFRIVPGSYDENIIREITELGHEIGYHYEDLSLAAERRRAEGGGQGVEERKEEELVKVAIESFKENLAKLRRVVPVETICMHGSPLSRWDNRLLWKYYDYRDFGLTGEPYFDTDFNEVLYLTDTGRRWDGDSVNIRDKAVGGRRKAEGVLPSALSPQPSAFIPKIHSTFDIIKAAKESRLPDKIMLTVHPQRWDNRPLPWLRELIWQNIKNTGKLFLNRQ